MKQLKNVHKPLFSPWDTLGSPFHWGFSSSHLDCQTFLPLPLWNGNTKLSTLKKKTHLKHLNDSLLTKPDDKGNSLLYEGNLSPAYDQNIHLRENFLTECHGAPIVTRIRRHLGLCWVQMVSRPLCQNGFKPIKMIKMYFEDVERGFRLAWHKTPTLFESNNTRPVSCWFIWLFGNWQQRSNSLNSRKWRMRIRDLCW